MSKKANKKKKLITLASLKALADLKVLLVVFAVVLVAMGIFAFSFRQSHVAYVEDDSYAVVSELVVQNLRKGVEEKTDIHLSEVKRDSEIIARGGNYFIAPEMKEYQADFPLYGNDGQNLYFVNDTAKLVTEEFEHLDIYGGMFVADGNSFNADREQADIETIYFTKLDNGLHINTLPLNFVKQGMTEEMPVNSIAHFDTECVRFYDEKSGVLKYSAWENVTGLSVQMDGKEWDYQTFYELLFGLTDPEEADSEDEDKEKPQPEVPEVPEDESGSGAQTGGEGAEESGAEAGDESAAAGTGSDTSAGGDSSSSSGGSSSSSGGDSSSSGNDGSSSDGSEGDDTSGGEDGEGDKTTGSEGMTGSESQDGETTDESTGSEDTNQGEPGDANQGEEEDSEDSKPADRPSTGEPSTQEPPVEKPKITVKNIVAGAYWIKYDVEIEDEYGYLKKLTSRVRWNGGSNQQRKSVKEEGTYTVGNLQSDREMTLSFEMKYRNAEGTYVTEEVFSTTVHTLSIEEGTNTLYLDYVPDTWDEKTQTGGYPQIYPEQMEIRDLKVVEGNDSIVEDENSTMDYARYFRVKVYDADSFIGEPVITYVLGNTQKRAMMTEEGLDWLSDAYISPLESDKHYYYEFEITDRYGEALKVSYEEGENGYNRYDANGKLITGKDSDRQAYTCKHHPTGKLSLGAASYDTQRITATLDNPDLGLVSDLHLTIQDIYGRYLEYTEKDGNAVGSIGTGILTDKGRYMFMEGVTTETSEGPLPLYIGVKDKGYDNTAKKQSWEKVEVPSFADNTYTINLNISYNIGDRQGVYTKVLASRSNSKTTQLQTLGNVSFSRAVEKNTAKTVSYKYSSVEVPDKLLPLIYRYEYLLTEADNTSNVPLKLHISKEYEEIKEPQGIVLTIPEYGEMDANDWSFNYSYQYRERNDTSKTVHTVSGRIYLDGSEVKRTILVDGNPQTGNSTETVAVQGGDILQAFYTMLDLDTCAKVRNNDAIDEKNIITESALQLSLDFAPIVDKNGAEEYNVNENYTFGMNGKLVRDTIEYLHSQADKDFSDVILQTLARESSPMNVTVGGLESSKVYEASAYAYAYQTGSLNAKTDEDGNVIYGEQGEPEITKVTSTDTTLKLQTLKGQPKVSMEIFSTSNDLTLFEFYVLDTDGSIVTRTGDDGPSVTVSIYRVDTDEFSGEESETLVDRVTGIVPARTEAEIQMQDLTFGGLTKGQKYRIKVTARAYDETVDGSNTVYDYLIGESDGTTFWKDEGIWENVVGTSITTDVMVEEVLSTDPFTLENQLLDFTSADDPASGWQIGKRLAVGDSAVVSDWQYMLSPMIDLRQYDENNNPIPLTYDDVFVMRGIMWECINFYDADGKWLTKTSYVRSGPESGANNWTIVTLPYQFGSADKSVSDIAYARVTVQRGHSNEAFFGRLDEGYFTKSEDGTGDFIDLMGSPMKVYDWDETLGTAYSNPWVLDKDGRRVQAGRNLYKAKISIKEDQVVSLHMSRMTGRHVVFFDENDRMIQSYAAENGTTGYLKYTNTQKLLVAPKGAVYMMIEYSSVDLTTADKEIRIYDASITENYNEWRESATAVKEANQILNDGKTIGVARYRDINIYSSGAIQTSTVQYETTTGIAVTPGDVYWINNWMEEVNFYDKDDKVISTDYMQSHRADCYMVVPEGAAYMRLTFNRGNQTSEDWSLLNGVSYNQGGAYEIIIYKCGNLKDVYRQKIAEGGSKDEMYANLRIQLKDGVNNYLTQGLNKEGSYWLKLYEADYNGEEVSEETLMSSTPTEYARGTIRVIGEGADAHGEEINRCVVIPVEKGKSYKAILYANIGSRSSVELGDCYFTVDEAGTKVRGINCKAQFYAIRNDRYGNYILNEDIEIPQEWNVDTFYGVLDLQGRTILNHHYSGWSALVNNLGTIKKRQGTIKNGTIILDETPSGSTDGYYGKIAKFVYTNYGTLENLMIKVSNGADYEIIDGQKVYDYGYLKYGANHWVIESNHGTIRNFTIEYVEDVVAANNAVFIANNNGIVENGYIYGDGALYGGGTASGLVRTNNANGVVRNIYSLVDTKTTSNYSGTIVMSNNGLAENLLATGNPFTYTRVAQDDNYIFTSENYLSTKGNAVGATGGRRRTYDVYYATVGQNRRIDYADKYNERVEGGMLLDPQWYIDLFGEEMLDMENLHKLVGEEFYPWIDMGPAAEKYDIIQPYLPLDLGATSSFDLTKTEVLDYVYDADGYAYANVRFSFLNPGNYEITDIMLDGLECTISSQGMNELTNFYEVDGIVKVAAGGDYVSEYNVKAVYYRRTANGTKTSIRYSFGDYVSASGERLLEAEFYYPLRNTQEWTEIFTSEKAHWNFRIWGAEVWDFLQPYYITVNGESRQRYPQVGKYFTYKGKLDGTLFAEQEDGTWAPVVENGQLQLHVLKNMYDYNINYNNKYQINGYGYYGYVFNVIAGSISNIAFEDFSVGVEREELRAIRAVNDNWLVDKETYLKTSLGEVRQIKMTSNRFGLVNETHSNAEFNNVHINGAYLNPHPTNGQYMGAFAAYPNTFTSFTNCSVTDSTIISSTYSSTTHVGGFVGEGRDSISFTGCYASDLDMQALQSEHSNFSPNCGGMIGYAQGYSYFTDCYVSGSFASKTRNVGGFAGKVVNMQMSNCYSALNVSFSAGTSGGFVGENTDASSMTNCMYVGAFSSASQSSTVHLFAGNMVKDIAMTNCYAYQPHMSAADAFVDKGITLKSYDELTTDGSFYQSMYGDGFLYEWQCGGKTCNTTASGGAYMPALKDAEGGLLYGQDRNGICLVPAIAEENIEIKDVWAFTSTDRPSIATASGGKVQADLWHGNNLADFLTEFYESLDNMNPPQAHYVPNDIEFTLVLGNKEGRDKPAYGIRSIEVESLADGSILNASNFTDNSGMTGVFSKEMLDSKVYSCDITPVADENVFAYKVRLLGTEVVEYRDNYNVVITLDNGVVIKQAFMFRNEDGVEDAKFLEISNAYEWNLYLANDGIIDDLAANASTGDPLYPYKGMEYKGYYNDTMNIEITGTVDFAVLKDVVLNNKTEEPQMNVMANQVRGSLNKNISSGENRVGALRNLDVLTNRNKTYALFRTVSGDMKNLRFEDNTIRWKVDNIANDNAGIVALSYGTVENCSFKNTVLTGGGQYFGIFGRSYGSMKDITVINSYIESDSNYVGGLAGWMNGDLINITAYGDLTQYKEGQTKFGYEVTGSGINVGGLVGILYSFDHEVNGHTIIGGADYTVALAEGQEEDERENLNPNGWLNDVMVEGNYGTTSSNPEAFRRDSLSYNYAHVKDITIYSVTVNSRRYNVGGVIGQMTALESNRMGYGYLIAENIDIGAGEGKEVKIHKTGTESSTGGFIGSAATVMVHDVNVNGLLLDSAGSGTGGLIGQQHGSGSFDYSAFGTDGERLSNFLSVYDDIDMQNVTVYGRSETGGVFGYRSGYCNAHDFNLQNIKVFGQTGNIGGFAGYYFYSKTTDLVMNDIQVYSTGGGNVAGIAGFAREYVNFNRFEMTDVQVVGAGGAGSVGGVIGYCHTDTYAMGEENHPNKMTNIYVYGNSSVGGIRGSGTGGAKYFELDNIKVVGTGSNIGGIIGAPNTGDTVSYVNAKNITVVGSGVCIGGVFGKGPHVGAFMDNHFENIHVTAGGADVLDGYSVSLDGGVKLENLPAGSLVGGLEGTRYSYTTHSRNTLKNIQVYATGNYVGGIVGNGNTMQYTSAENILVEAAGEDAEYIGGIIGCAGGSQKSAYKNVKVVVPNAKQYIGGHSGKSGSVSNTILESTVEVGGTNPQYVGGVSGHFTSSRGNIQYMTVETTVNAPTADYVGGIAGYVDVTADWFYHYRNVVVADVTGHNYVSGMLGWMDDYAYLSGTYGDVLAAKVKATAPDAKISYIYNAPVDNQIISDRTANYVWYNIKYPYSIRLWDGSSLEVNRTVTPVADTIFHHVSTTEDYQPLYWSGSLEDGAAKETNTYKTALFSSEDAKTEALYQNIGWTTHTMTVEGNQATISGMENLTAGSNTDRFNFFPLNNNMTEGDVVYLPITMNPIILCKEKVATTNWYYGSATLEGETMTVTIKDGISIPGETGSILDPTYVGGGSGTVLEDIVLRAKPKIYSTNAFTLNVEFTAQDTIAGGHIVVSYDKRGDSVGTYSIPLEEGVYTYSMYYDFMTPLVIEITDRAADGTVSGGNAPTVSGSNAPTGNHKVVYSVNIDPVDYSKRIAMSSNTMFVIGKDGNVFQYRNGWNKDSELVEIKGFEAGEKCINIGLHGASAVAVLTDHGHILYVSTPFSDEDGFEYEGKYLAGVVGPADKTTLNSAPVMNTSLDDEAGDMSEGEPVASVQMRDVQFVGTSANNNSEGASNSEALSNDKLLSGESDVEFDDSLLDAEPLFEFDYKGYHICTYLNYSLIFDGDEVTVRNMQLFVKNGQLFALNAPEDIVPGSILIDNYQGHAYMTVLSQKGKLVDLMDPIKYPEDFVNKNIKNLATNLYSDLTFVTVEYEDGGIVSFNYHTGTVLFAEEGSGEFADDNVDFLDYVMGFFGEKLDTAYGDVSNAYQNAQAMQEFLSHESWEQWNQMFQESEDSAMQGNEGGKRPEDMPPGALPEDGMMATENANPGEMQESTDSLLWQESESEEYAVGGGEGLPGGTGAEYYPEELESEAVDTLGEESERVPSGDEMLPSGGGMYSEDLTEEGLAAEEALSEELASSEGETAPAAGDGIFADELIIAYNGEDKEYAVYSAQDLLTEEEEKLTSVDKKMEEFVEKGGELKEPQPEIGSLEVGGSQKIGLVILGVTGGAIVAALAALGVQRYAKRERKGRRR